MIWADGFDGNLCYWIFEWGFHALIKSGDPSNFWHANTFHPMPYSLAVSESFLSAQLIYAPLRLIGVTPLVAMYFTLGLSFIVVATLTDFFVQKIGFHDLSERSLIVVMSHCLMPTTMMLYHYQLFGFLFAPSFFVTLVLFLKSPTAKNIFWVCAIYVLASCYSAYMAPMLLAAGLPIVTLMLLEKGPRGGIRAIFSEYCTKVTFLTISGWATLLYLVQFRPYLIISNSFPRTKLSEAIIYSSRWHSIFTGKSKHSLWYGAVDYGAGDWERTLFLGYIPLVALTCGIFLLLREKWKNSAGNALYAEKNLWLITFFWILLLSSGPFLSANPNFSLPFKWLAGFIPGLSSVRTPGRFGMLLGIPLGFFLVLTIRDWFRWRSKSMVCIVLSVFCLVEGVPNFSVEKFRRVNWSTYQDVAMKLPENSTLLELPLAVGDNYAVLMNAMDQMKGSTLHWSKIVAGYGAKTAPSFAKAVDLDRRFHGDPSLANEIFKFMRVNKFRYLLIHLEQVDQKYADALRAAVIDCYACRVVVDDSYFLIDSQGGDQI